MRNISIVLAIVAIAGCTTAFAENRPVGISRDMMSVEVTHLGKPFEISRAQDNKNTVNPDYAITSRPCPPFCIRPIQLAPGVETIAELEMLEYLVAARTDPNILVIDSRTPDWVKKGTIPGSVSIPWTLLNPETSDPLTIGEIMQEKFGAIQDEELWDFKNVKTLVMFCNGMWCGQSPRNIFTLLRYGYPADKIKWYRGGMQDWEILGLTTVPGS